MSTMKYDRPSCFGTSGFVRDHEHSPAREMRDRGPHLLAVHHPVVAVAHRARGEARDVGARARLAEHLAPDVLAREDARQVVLLLRLARVGEHGGRAHADADRAHRRIVMHDLRVLRDLVLHRQLLLRADAQAPVTLREVHPRQAVLELLAAEGDRVGALRMRFREQLLNAPAKLGFGHLAQIGHGVSLGTLERPGRSSGLGLYGESFAGFSVPSRSEALQALRCGAACRLQGAPPPCAGRRSRRLGSGTRDAELPVGRMT